MSVAYLALFASKSSPSHIEEGFRENTSCSRFFRGDGGGFRPLTALFRLD